MSGRLAGSSSRRGGEDARGVGTNDRTKPGIEGSDNLLVFMLYQSDPNSSNWGTTSPHHFPWSASTVHTSDISFYSLLVNPQKYFLLPSPPCNFPKGMLLPAWC
jgi:hypothetical protein